MQKQGDRQTVILKRIATFLLCLSAGACSLLVNKNTHDYPQWSKAAFISSCESKSGGKKDFCSCMLAKVQEHYTYGEMTDIEQKIKSGQTPAEFTEFTTKTSQACLAAESVQR